MTKSRTESSKSYLLKDDVSFSRERERLRWQAQTLSKLELPSLLQLGLNTPKNILELGCGNGQYLLQWQEVFQGAAIAGVDRNEKLLELARGELQNAPFFQHDLLSFKDLKSTIEHFKPDTIILRFVLQHLNEPECDKLLEFLSQHKDVGSFQLVLIDPDDSTISFQPDCAELTKATQGVIQKQAANGGDRTRGSRLGKLCQHVGFQNVKTAAVDVGSKTIGWAGVRTILVPLWKQGLRTDEEFLAVEKWLEKAETLPERSVFSSQVHLVVAR